MANLIDYNLLHTRVMKYQQDLNLEKLSEAFTYVAMETILGLPIYEIENSIVDGPQDRGIDAIYIEEEDNEEISIHLFQFKYAITPSKMNNNFPGTEVDKVITLIEDMLSLTPRLQDEVNPDLWNKIQDIQEVFNRKSLPKVRIYFCGNMQELALHEKNRVEGHFRKYNNFYVEHYSLDRLVKELAQKPRRKINGKIHFVDDKHFERSSRNINAVIGIVSAFDLIELIKDKNNPEQIEEAIFEDNIRLYQGIKKNPVNLAIFKSALNEETNHEFLYLNNGITMTCEKISYTKKRNPVVDLTNVQIVNGSQTSHTLFEAYQSLPDDDKSALQDVLLLVRIYVTDNKDIVSRIVETTNSQTVIGSRDLKANDPVQWKLEIELKDKGYFYERKKNFYDKEESHRRLDAQVVGQVLMSFYHGQPDQVKYRRREIFGKSYDEIFKADTINADSVLNPMIIFQYIEKRKADFKKEVRSGNYDERKLFLPHGSFFVLYGLKVISDQIKLQYSYQDINALKQFYEPVVNILAEMVASAEGKQGKKYSHNSFFRDKKTVVDLEEKILDYLIENNLG